LRQTYKKGSLFKFALFSISALSRQRCY